MPLQFLLEYIAELKVHPCVQNNEKLSSFEYTSRLREPTNHVQGCIISPISCKIKHQSNLDRALRPTGQAAGPGLMKEDLRSASPFPLTIKSS